MPKTSKLKASADEIAAKATRGEDVSAHFTNKFTVVKPYLNVSRPAVIKTRPPRQKKAG